MSWHSTTNSFTGLLTKLYSIQLGWKCLSLKSSMELWKKTGCEVVREIYELRYQLLFLLVVKNSPASAGDIRDVGSIPGLGRSTGKGHGSHPLQYPCLENSMDRGDWWAIVHRVPKSWTRLKQLSTHAQQIIF